MIGSKLNIVFITDLHFGNLRVPAKIMHNNFVQMLYPKLDSSVDLLIVGGDFFDTLLDLSGESAYFALLAIKELIALSEKNGFLIRVVRGTFTHDRHQNQFWTVGSGDSEVDDDKFINGDAQVRVFDTISIEHITSLDLSIMYIPDDLPYDDAMPVIKDLMRDHQIDKVDIVMNHGYFDHLLPQGIPHVPKNCFTASDFKNIARIITLNGHIHLPLLHKDVLSGGSFERLCQNEEEAKGFWSIHVCKETSTYNAHFNENKNTTIFSTIDMVKQTDVGEAITVFKEWYSNLCKRDRSGNSKYLRIITDDNILYMSILTYVKENLTGVIMQVKSPSKKRQVKEELEFQVLDLPIITESNLPEMISSTGKLKLDVDLSPDRVVEILNCNRY